MVFSDDFLHFLKIKNFFWSNSPKLSCGFNFGQQCFHQICKMLSKLHLFFSWSLPELAGVLWVRPQPDADAAAPAPGLHEPQERPGRRVGLRQGDVPPGEGRGGPGRQEILVRERTYWHLDNTHLGYNPFFLTQYAPNYYLYNPKLNPVSNLKS